MGKFDIDKTYEQGYNPKMIDLCEEIISELEPDTSSIVEEQIRAKFKNSRNSGLIDKFKKLLSYDIEKNAGEDPEQKFAMMQILKLIYMLEKKGCLTKEELSKNNPPVHIIDILSKPCLDNIMTVFSNATVYGEAYNNLLEMIGNKVLDLKSREEHIYDANHRWEVLSLEMYDNIISNDAIFYQSLSLENLKSLCCFLEDYLLPQIDIWKCKNIPYFESVYCTFYNIMYSHYYLCYDSDRKQVNDELSYKEKPSEKYIEYFNLSESWQTDYSILEKTIQFFNGVQPDEQVKHFWNLISYQKDISNDDISSYIYALENTEPIIHLIEKYHNKKMSENINVSLLVSIVQEIFDVRKNTDKLTNKHHNHNSNKKSFLRALLNLDNADSIIAVAWDTKIKNRIISNFGMNEHLAYKRKIENYFYEIKEYVFSHKNLIHIEKISYFLSWSISEYIRLKYDENHIDRIMNVLKNRIENIYQK